MTYCLWLFSVNSTPSPQINLYSYDCGKFKIYNLNFKFLILNTCFEQFFILITKLINPRLLQSATKFTCARARIEEQQYMCVLDWPLDPVHTAPEIVAAPRLTQAY